MRIELLLLLSFLAMIIVLIACSAPRRSTSVLSPTFFPAMTLTAYDPQLITRVEADVAIPATIQPPPANLTAIEISPPRCFKTTTPQVTCLGLIGNGGETAISDVTLNARFTDGAGASLGENSFSLEQRQIAAGTSAPYRLQLPDALAEPAALEIALLDARSATAPALELTLDDVVGVYLPAAAQYHLTATLRNTGEVAAAEIRLIVTLENAEGALIGYRAYDVQEALPRGEQRTLDLYLTPLETAAVMRHHVLVEAIPAAQP